MIDFPHSPPEGYSYEFTEPKCNTFAIWLCHPDVYTYTSHPVKTIWGFYRSNKKTYHAPIDSNRVGKKVLINNTTSFSAMQLKLNPLEAVLFS